jgi:hypothetical protein
LQLYDHPNTQVRLNAAMATLAVASQAARKALDEIWASQWFPQAAVAGMMIKALDSLFEHPNMQVRLNAAKATLAVAPKAARQALEAIAASRHHPQAGDAGMSLWNLDEGVFKPT